MIIKNVVGAEGRRSFITDKRLICTMW